MEFELDLDFLKSLISDFDLMTLLPNLVDVMDWVITVVNYCLVIGPLVLTALGLLYLLLPTREANHFVGYRFFWGMGSITSWRFTQRLAGAVWAVMGIILALEANDFRANLDSLEKLDMMYQSAELLLKQVIYVVASCVAINGVVFFLFNFQGEVRWVWRKLAELMVKCFGDLVAFFKKLIQENMGKKPENKSNPERRPRRIPGQNAKTNNNSKQQ